ncbi:MAG: thiolase family protein [Sulfitobacter sp.]
MRKRQNYNGVVLVAPHTEPYQRYSTQTAHWWMARALRGTLKAAGLAKSDIDGFCASSFSLFPDTAVGLTQHLGLCLRWLDHIPMGGASGIVALRRGARAIQAGDADIIACVAADTNHIDSFRKLLGGFSRFASDATFPYGAGGPNMSFALLTDTYMKKTGAIRADFGKICVAQRDNARHYPPALIKKPLGLEEYLAARMISDPIGLFDCVMPCAGGEAFLMMSEERAARLGVPFVRISGLIERHNAHAQDAIQQRGGWTLDIDELYQMADTTPQDIDLLQTYDDYPVICMMQLEDLGFCAKGDAPAFVQAHDLTIKGDFPHNTSGGQLSGGQAGAAGGYLGLTEAIRQLTNRAGPTQVMGAKRAMVSGFGMINYDRGLCTGAAILTAGDT